MGFSERLATWTTVVVLFTGVAVGTAVAWSTAQSTGTVPIGLLARVGLATLIGLWFAHAGRVNWLARDQAIWEDLARRVERIAVKEALSERLPDVEDREVVRVTHAINDLLERLAEQATVLSTESALARSLLDLSPSGVLVVEADDRIRFANPSFRRMVPPREEPVGALPGEVLPVPEVLTAVREAREKGRSREISCTSGNLDIVLEGVRLPDDGAMVLVQNVTRYLQAERVRTDFVSNVSHELRTPMASIMGYAETLLADADQLDAEVIPLVEAIYRNGKRLRDLFEDLLELSRIEARRGELSVTLQPLRPILEAAVTSAADRAAQRGQSFELSCKRRLTAWVNAEALAAIVGNLAGNASDYTGEGGRIVVSAERRGEEVVIAVVDDGIGIDPAAQERIFERFYRIDEGRSRRAGGTGLGLAIVKHLSMASGCHVTVQSEVGKGSCFEVHLPDLPQHVEDPD